MDSRATAWDATVKRKAQQAFIQRQIKREKEERIGKCIKQITRDCKDMLKKKLEEIEDFNSSMPQHKYKKYNCFYCKQEGHIIKLCPIKIKDEAEHAQNLSDETAEGNYCVLPTQSKFTLDKTLNILSMNLLQQQGFEIIFEGDKCILEYMFKDQQGQNLNVDKMRQMHNNYLEDYFESLDKERANKTKRRIGEGAKGGTLTKERFDRVLTVLQTLREETNSPGTDSTNSARHGGQIYLFDLYKLVDCMGGYLSVNFGQEFDAIAEILGLTKGDGEEIKRCYISYLDVFTSYYKTARASQIPTKVEEDSESLVSYQWNMDRTCAPKAVQKGKEKLE
ncbi:ARID DNA-binding domain-containing protein [Tanacetum coccineum]